jgi:hypothetical protein
MSHYFSVFDGYHQVPEVSQCSGVEIQQLFSKVFFHVFQSLFYFSSEDGNSTLKNP